MTDHPLKIIFMGTPDFSVEALRALLDSHHSVICVYTQPPRPKGRGQHLQKSPVHLLADSASIPVRHPYSLKKDDQARQDLIDLKADVAVVAAYGLILPKDVLEAPKFGCINIHASLLPRWRGASPIQRAIWAGDSQSGITIMQMEEGLDTGPMIAKEAVSITPETTAIVLHDALSFLGGKLIVPVLDRLAAEGRLEAETQNDALTCYAPLLTKEDGRVQWEQGAIEIDRQVRALNPWPGVWTMQNGQRLKLLETALSDQTIAAEPGMLIDKTGAVACAGGKVLLLKKIQPDNANPMDVASAINGKYLTPGLRFD